MLNTFIRTATLGGGCFWCLEAVYQEVDGVTSVVSGYAGGSIENPTYEQVCSGNSGHAEVIQIQYDSQRVTFENLLNIFWKIHDPTTLNRQGHDRGTQYRSVIFYHDEEQKRIAEESKANADQQGLWPDPIVTEISPLTVFYPAERYHQNFFRQNPNHGYCSAIIVPKMTKFRHDFPNH